VKACVNVARTYEVQQGAAPYFDAYYNAGNGTVENNAIFRPTLFVFQKCMAERGFPLVGKEDGGTDGLPKLPTHRAGR
jgi:hypothetical protein